MQFGTAHMARWAGTVLLAILGAATFVASGTARAQSTACGTTTWNLTAGQHIYTGTVTVSNDLNNLYVTYAIDTAAQPTATFGTLHAWVGSDLLLLPRAGKNSDGAPIQGKFPYQGAATGSTSYTFSIPFGDLSITDVKSACGTPLYVVTHAEVEGVCTPGTDPVTGLPTCTGSSGETAYGGDTAGDGNRWWFYGKYSVCCDFGPPPIEKCTTAYGKGSHVWTTDRKSNPENLPSLNLTRNRWGWATNVTAPGTYTAPLWAGAGLNNTANGVNVGTVTIDWDGTNATVTYNVVTGDLKEAHVYVGDSAPATIAPGQYGHTAYLASGATSYTVTLPAVDANGGGVWIAAHSVACHGVTQ